MTPLSCTICFHRTNFPQETVSTYNIHIAREFRSLRVLSGCTLKSHHWQTIHVQAMDRDLILVQHEINSSPTELPPFLAFEPSPRGFNQINTGFCPQNKSTSILSYFLCRSTASQFAHPNRRGRPRYARPPACCAAYHAIPLAYSTIPARHAQGFIGLHRASL